MASGDIGGVMVNILARDASGVSSGHGSRYNISNFNRLHNIDSISKILYKLCTVVTPAVLFQRHGFSTT